MRTILFRKALFLAGIALVFELLLSTFFGVDTTIVNSQAVNTTSILAESHVLPSNMSRMSGSQSSSNNNVTYSTYGVSYVVYGVTGNVYGVTGNVYGVTGNVYGVTNDVYGVTNDVYGVTQNVYGVTGNVYGVSVTTSPLAFGGLQLSNQSSQVKIISTIVVQNMNDTPWAINISSTDFTSDLVNDPTSLSGGQMKVSFSSDNVKYRVISLKEFGPNTTNTAINVSQSKLRLNKPKALLVSSNSSLAGRYEVSVEFTLDMPKTAKVTQIQGSDSKYNVGSEVGLLLGNYKANVVVEGERR
jgi:hypothetical protein